MKAQDLPRDSNGVPFVYRDFIELKAEEVIQWVDPRVLERVVLTPLNEIADRLRTQFHVPFDFGRDLGFTRDKRKILGGFRISDRRISIDGSLEPDSPRWRFTLAHEIGHLVFHRTLKLVESRVVGRTTEIDDTERELGDILQPTEPRDWIEWQANKFASSLLMPRRPFRSGTRSAMCEAGIDRRSERIYLDEQRCNLSAFRAVVSHLTEKFCTSRTATEIRLKELDLVLDARASDSPDFLFRTD